MLTTMSLADPVGTIMSRRLADDNVRSCDPLSESAAEWRSVFPVAAPGRRARSGDFAERPPEMHVT
jgi:hypothetical protein